MKEQDELLVLIEFVFSQTMLPHIDDIYGNERCKIEYTEFLGQTTWQETILYKLYQVILRRLLCSSCRENFRESSRCLW